MVLFGSQETHCVSSMGCLSKLRQEDSLCDAYLVVGDQRIPAHRCVLVAGSDYFRARFVGPLRDDDKPDVDLSSVDSNAAYVEKVVHFMYEGVVDIDQENLEALLKLASFLLISKLKDYCSMFMEKTRSVDTIVKYYLLAAVYAIDTENSLKETVRTRFHDWLMFDESVLQVTPNQIRFLLKTCNIFDHCSYTDMVKFIKDWVKTGNSESHEVLGCELLESARKMKHRRLTQENSNEEKSNEMDKLKLFLQAEGPDADHIIKLTKSPDDLKMDERNVDCTKSESAEQLDTHSCRSSISDSEPMVLTISPKQCLKKALEERPWTNSIEGTQLSFEKTRAIFDVCAYVPKTRTWYRLNEGQYRGFYKRVVFERGCWQFTARMDTMYCLPYARCYGNEELDFLSLLDFRFRRISYRGMLQLLEPDERDFDNMCIVTDDNTVYLVSLISDISSDIPKYFKCFKLTSNNKWEFVFRSQTTFDASAEGMVSAAFSAVSNEMLLIFSSVTDRIFSLYNEHSSDKQPDMIPCELFAFVANLGNDEPSQVTVHRLSVELDISDTSCSWQILQDENQFYLLADEHINGGFRLAHKYKYVYHSKVLTPVNSNKEVIGESIVMKGEVPRSNQVLYTAASNDDHSVWLFKGNDQNTSTLTEASVDSNGNTVIQAHKPPPFTCVTAFVAGKISRDCLDAATPVKRYLED